MLLTSRQEQGNSKSYVLRKGRATKAQKKALKNLKQQYVISLSKHRLDFSKIFQDPERKLIADVGFGSGESLLHMAEKCKEENFVGIEVYPSGIGKVLNQIEKKGLTNLKIIEADVFSLLKTKVINETFDVMIFLYPDPWPKRKHHKRRLLSEDFLNLLHDKITSGGLLYCMTDWEDYYLQVKEEISLIHGWLRENLASLPEPLKSLPQTKYKKKALTEGRHSNELFFRKISR